jgi:hypothetical protein
MQEHEQNSENEAEAAEPEEVKNLEQLLERMSTASDGRDEVSIGHIMEQIGSRSFGPLLLLAGVILVSPLSGIPGMPTTISVFVLIIAVQLFMRRDHFWLPHWLLNRSISHKKLCKAVHWLQKPARGIDRLLKPRMKLLTHSGGTRLIALICIIIALLTPPLEILPFAASSAGAALMAFALSLITEDGLMALIAVVFATGAMGTFLVSIF